jgi:predicted RNase H-like nuclease
MDAHVGLNAYPSVRDRFLVKDVGHDDILDAFAVLWSAERIFRGRHRLPPERPPFDIWGLRMEIVY